MTTLHDRIESAIASLKAASEDVDDLASYDDAPQPENEWRKAIGHIDDAISELNEAKAMLY